MAKIKRLEGKDKRVFRLESGVMVRTIVPPVVKEPEPPGDPDDPEALTGMDWYFSADEEE